MLGNLLGIVELILNIYYVAVEPQYINHLRLHSELSVYDEGIRSYCLLSAHTIHSPH